MAMLKLEKFMSFEILGVYAFSAVGPSYTY